MQSEGLSGAHHKDAEDEGKLKLLQNSRNLSEERCAFRFLSRGAPSHVDAEHVACDGLEDVDRKATEEDREEGQPFEVLQKAEEEVAAFDSVL